ncbi:hypothetical protein Cme02nite_16230 [Catellatospora methionotrophica]|uniref:Uncharacterized protein n=1 Tax=Catellatospora methionotrophica TaxID=121620 RepID=A0A8J3PDA5_9ACTN|nr:hypothetical protein [Catellatospora methionotrophica]GIG13291.1 hypothetical protein Cme02nite_16230 [Catellatospora methionotrophica]
MDAENLSGAVPEPLRVEPDELIRLGGGLARLAEAVAGEVPSAVNLTRGPSGWAVTGAQLRLAHEVGAYLAAFSDDLASFGERLCVAGLSYADRDSGLARAITAAGVRR